MARHPYVFNEWPTSASNQMKIGIEFSGGLELLFNNQKLIECEFPDGEELDVQQLMFHCRDKLLQERPELFMKGDTVRPGVLVLINSEDWELSEKEKTKLQDGDMVTFISTLHGG